jgi:hypothetical protein
MKRHKEDHIKMKKLKNFKKNSCFPVLLFFFTSLPILAEGQEVPKEVKALAGTYSGSWTMYGIDANCNIVEKMKWTDTMEATNPVIKDGRAYVVTIDKMKFADGIPPQEIKGTEGYFINSDGNLGDYYFENFGQVTKMVKLGEKTWVYSMPVYPDRLSFLGFSNVISGRQIVVKEITDEDGTEIHRICIVTTVNWKDKDGKINWKQFISMLGYHKRMKNGDERKQ